MSEYGDMTVAGLGVAMKVNMMMLAIFPIIIPIIAVLAFPSARIMLLKLLLTIRKGIPAATIFRYWEV